MDKGKILEDIFNNDPLGILNVKPRASRGQNADERLVSSFQEVNDFVNENGREPEPNVKNVTETQLYYRLKSLREDNDKAAMLKDHDPHDMLQSASLVNEPEEHYEQSKPKEINSIDDILGDDSLDILGDDSEGLFTFNHTPKDYERASTDFVAQRKPCKDFDLFEDKLRSVQHDLAHGKRKMVAFKQDNLRPGDYYVHNGVLLYLDHVDFEEEVQEFKSGKRARKDGRTRTIFENGTESRMLYRSLYKALLDNGKSVTRNSDDVSREITTKLSGVSEDDIDAGYIYVLESLSEDERITSIKNLYKIGYSKNLVEKRIQNAQDEPTYLMAPVRVMGEWQCFNMKPQKLEQLLHNFFGASCLDIDIIDRSGRRHRPQEWFIAPLEVVEEAIDLIMTGEVVNYRYDAEGAVIVRK